MIYAFVYFRYNTVYAIYYIYTNILIICKTHRQSEQILSSEVNLYIYTQTEYVGISEHYIGPL